MNFNNPKHALTDILKQKKQNIAFEIEKLSNEIIMANSIEDLMDNLNNKYFIELIQLSDEENGRQIKEEKIRKYNQFYNRDSYFEKEYYEVPGFTVNFSHNINGSIDLLFYHASHYLMWHPDNITINKNTVTLSYSEALNDNIDATMNKITSSYEQDFNKLKNIISNTNKDIAEFNSTLPNYLKETLERKKKQISLFHQFSERLAIPLKQSPNAPSFKPISVIKNTKPLKTKVDKETEYYIPDTDYEEILRRIRHIGSSFEKTPNTFVKLDEEELRDIIVAQLNVDYEGQVQGESFRNNGKTDICVEYNNRAAFVTECKFWKGKQVLNYTIEQLLNYTTWHDSKLAIVFFSKTNKDFFKVIETIKESLKLISSFKSLKLIRQNEIELILNSINQGQIIKIRIFVFNLYIKKLNSKQRYSGSK